MSNVAVTAGLPVDCAYPAANAASASTARLAAALATFQPLPRTADDRGSPPGIGAGA